MKLWEKEFFFSFFSFIFQYSVIMIVILAIEIGLGVYAGIKKDQLDGIFEGRLNQTLHGIKKDDRLYVAWHSLQYGVNQN